MDLKQLPVTFLGDDWVAFATLAPELPDLPWLVWQSTRNAVIEALRPFGSIGPTDCFPLALAVMEKDEAKVMQAWPVGADDPDFYVLDDQSNHAPLQRVEVKDPSLLSIPMLGSLWKWSQGHQGWCVELAFPDFEIHLRQDGIWTGGVALKDCRSVDELVTGR